MIQFKILNNNATFPLTVFNYEKVTKKNFPYYQCINGKIKHFAICPICGNPIQIINLYNKNIISDKGLPTLYAKHYSKSVDKLATYNKNNFMNCPLRSKTSFNSHNKHSDKGRFNEIVNIYKKNKELIKRTIQAISGINFSQKKVENIFEKFQKEEGYYYEAVNKFNIPYSVLYLSGNQNIFGQYINKNNEELIKSFENSIFFELNEYQIVSKDSYFAEINLYFLNFKDSKNSFPTMTMIIEEKSKGQTNKLFEKVVDIDISNFWNNVIE